MREFRVREVRMMAPMKVAPSRVRFRLSATITCDGGGGGGRMTLNNEQREKGADAEDNTHTSSTTIKKIVECR